MPNPVERQVSHQLSAARPAEILGGRERVNLAVVALKSESLVFVGKRCRSRLHRLRREVSLRVSGIAFLRIESEERTGP